jgi:hypothetical protein
VSALAVEPRLTATEWTAYHRDPTKNKDYQRKGDA